MIQIKKVQTAQDWNDFIDLPWKIYKGDPYWVPPLKMQVRDLLNEKKNPLFQHARMIPLLAFQGGKPIGRVVGIVDDRHNEFYKEKTAFFGFFESMNDPEIAHLLFAEVSKWAVQLGMDRIRGPVNPDTAHEFALLVEGFQSPPTVLMTYNPDYYPKLLEGMGFTKAKDFFAYGLEHGGRFGERLRSQAERLKKRNNITFRPVNMRKFRSEIGHFLEIYNDAWEENWGFVPVDPSEVDSIAKDLKPIIDPRIIFFAEIRGEIAGVSLALPDVNQALYHIKDGKLFPTGIFKLLWNLKGPGRKKTINRCLIWALGVKRKYQQVGLGPLFYSEYFKVGKELGYQTGEAALILETNKPMNRALELMGARKTKTYRVYDRMIDLQPGVS